MLVKAVTLSVVSVAVYFPDASTVALKGLLNADNESQEICMGVFGFTPEDVYIEHNMLYLVATVPLTFTKPTNRLMIITPQTQAEIKTLMDRVKEQAKKVQTYAPSTSDKEKQKPS